MMLASSMNSPSSSTNESKKRKNSCDDFAYLHSPSSMDEAAFPCKKTKVTLETHLNVPEDSHLPSHDDAGSECHESTHDEYNSRDATNAPSTTSSSHATENCSAEDEDCTTSNATTASEDSPTRESYDDQYDPYGTEGYDDYGDANRRRRTLYLEYWTRSDECKERKWDHLDELDAKLDVSREDHIYSTTLLGRTSFMEPNMFPYDTPKGIEHWTLWSRLEMNHYDVQDYVEKWIDNNATHVLAWNYDDNPERSINIFHVHVYLQVGDNDSVLRGRTVEELTH
ncbi:hypothetical protein LEN26_005479 [Aphanomyces euteiches]|nr:hypothetical protein AeMF1_009946 [Aphanomyces euteiches]KAH9138005.1 hypothetical protein LEN26_005479 [Aphanomyces euteiches]KAH9197146.1 hypothetical protein AeNC1_000858 [Aphanomyces euteiches]